MSDSTFLRFTNENSYNLFSGKLSLTDVKDIPVFLHELYHHIQNTTTVLGAERFNYFIQSLAHISVLAKKSSIFYLPLDEWIKRETLMTSQVAGELLEIYDHGLMWDYLEKRNDVLSLPETFADKHQSITVLKLDYFDEDEWMPTPVLVVKEKDELNGYMIGGHFVAESGAFGLEQFHNDQPLPTDNLLSEPKWYPYHCLQVILRKRISNSRLVHLAAFLVSDLAMIVSTPSMGLLRVLGYANDLNDKMTADDLMKWYMVVYRILEDDIRNAFELEKEHLGNTKRELEGSKDLLSKVIIGHIDQIIHNLDFRLQNPDFYIKSFTTSYSEERIQEILKMNPINQIQVGFEAPISESQSSYDSYEILNGLMKYYLGIKKESYPMLPDELIDKFNLPMNNFDLEYIHVNTDDDSFEIQPQIDSKETNFHGYLLRWLGLDSKKIQYLHPDSPTSHV